MALQLNNFAKRGTVLGTIQSRLGGQNVVYFYPSTVAIPAVPSSVPTGYLGTVTIPTALAFVQTNGQIKIQGQVAFTPTVTGTATWALFVGANSYYLATDSIVANGGTGVVTLSTLNLVNGTSATLVDFTLNLS